jgi:hypothetical protein
MEIESNRLFYIRAPLAAIVVAQFFTQQWSLKLFYNERIQCRSLKSPFPIGDTAGHSARAV